MRPYELSIGLILASLLVAHASAAAAVAVAVYKWTDAAGVVHYSDQPQPGAERILTHAPNISHAPQIQSRGGNAPASATARNSVEDYAAFEIDAPQAEQTFNDSTVTVRLHLAPELRANHAIALYLNSKLVENQPSNSLIFTLADLARGTHSLTATITDQISGNSRRTAPVTFHVHQTSMLSPLSPLRKKTP